nr:polysaccharide deacetylase family protein [Neptunicella marina]
MNFLADNDYQVINLQQLFEFLQGQRELPEKSVVITVDDGYRSYLDVAYPILKKHQFSSTLFVYPEFVGAGLALDWDEIRKLKLDPLVNIQSHSKTHDSLQPDPKGETGQHYQRRLHSEVVETDDIFEKRIGRRSSFFAYPYGNTSPQLIELLQANHYQLAFTVKKGGNANFASPYLLNRTMIYGGDSLERFSRNLKHYEYQNLK